MSRFTIYRALPASATLVALCIVGACDVEDQEPSLPASPPQRQADSLSGPISTLPVVSDVVEAVGPDVFQDQSGPEWLALNYVIVWPEVGIHEPTQRTACISLRKVSAGEVRRYIRHLVHKGASDSINVDLWNAYRNAMVPDEACAKYLLESEVNEVCSWMSTQLGYKVRMPAVDEILALDSWARSIAVKHGLDPSAQRPHRSPLHDGIAFSDLYDCSRGERLYGAPTKQLIEALNFAMDDEEAEYTYFLVFSRMDDTIRGLDIRAEGNDSRTDDVGFRLVRVGP